MSTKVFKYGAFPPAEDSAIRQQMKLGREYYNKLVEAENARRKAFWGGDSPPKPPHDHSNGDAKTCEKCKQLWRLQREAWRTISLLDLKPLRAEAIKTGLYWGTYLSVEESFSAAWKKTDCFSLLCYRSWKQGGYMGSQIQKVRAADKIFKLEHREDPRQGKKRRGTRYQCSIRIGTEKKEPIWSDPLRFIMHRPIQGRPTWIKICMRYRGDKEIWSLNITCADIPDRNDDAIKGMVAIDVGWRIMPPDERMRIAYAMGDDGREYEFSMGPEWRELTARADRIRGHRDDRLDVLKIPNPQLKLLKKPGNVRAFLLRNEMMTPELEEWCKRDRHLLQYEIGCRRRSEEKRRNDMRVWLRDLRCRYSMVLIKDSVHKEMKAHKKAVEDGMYPQSRRNAHHAAPGEVIEEVCKIWGRQTGVAIVKAAFTTAQCGCGNVIDIGAELMLKCERCGAEIDRDRQSTRNMLDLYKNGEDDKLKKPTARKTTARFAKRHKKNNELQPCPPDGL
jgi:hypothetical protein